MELKFRLLEADEIDVRISQITKNSVMLLLYKDARCDMNILDETVGPMNWQRSHLRENANCIVSIWDDEKKQWVSKEDTGTESNTEAEKGLASDSFKRACFNWGIGRELYTGPTLFFPRLDCNVTPNSKTQKDQCFDKFKVTEIDYENNKIKCIRILNLNTNKEYQAGLRPKTAKAQAEEKKAEAPKKEAQKKSAPKQEKKQEPAAESVQGPAELTPRGELIRRCAECGINPGWLASKYGWENIESMSDSNICNALNQNNWKKITEIYAKENS